MREKHTWLSLTNVLNRALIVMVVVAGSGGVAGAQPFVNTGNPLTSTTESFLAAADYDGDGDIDVFAGENNAPDTVWFNDGTGVFADEGLSLNSSSAQDAAAGDLNNDGFPDVVCAGNVTHVYINDGTGAFTTSADTFSNGSSQVIFDADGDGDLDILIVANGTVRLHRNDGLGNFTQDPNTSVSQAVTAAAGDFDGDGDLDLVIGVNASASSLVWFNNGDGTFTDSLQSLVGTPVRYVAVGDIDGDGDLDIVFADSSLGIHPIFLNDGNGNFSAGPTLTAAICRRVVLADFDLDGDLDILLVAQSGAHQLFLNDGVGNFTDSGQTFGTGFTNDVAVFDFDGDGDLDIVFGQVASSTVWRNNVAPRVVSIVRQDASPTADATVEFIVQFTHGVTGVDVSDFTLTTTGTLTGAQIVSVTPTGSADTYIVTVDTGTGLGDFGTLRLDLLDDDTIACIDAGAADLGGTGANNGDFSDGEAYTIDRRGPVPTVTSVLSIATNQSPIPIHVEFDEDVTGFDMADLAVTGGTASNFATISAREFTADITPSGDGTITVGILAATCTDLLGNPNEDFPTGFTIEFDSTSPSVTVEQAAGQADPAMVGTTVSYTITFSEPVTGFDSSDLDFDLSAFDGVLADLTDIDITGGPTVYTLTFTIGETGTVAVVVSAGAATDAAGNSSAGSTSTDNSITGAVPQIAITRGGSTITSSDDAGELVGKGTVLVLTYTIQNTGDVELMLASAPQITSTSGVNASVTYPGSTTIAPADSETFTVTIDALKNGQFEVVFTIESNDPATPTQTITISGTAKKVSGCGVLPNNANANFFWLLIAMLVCILAAVRRR